MPTGTKPNEVLRRFKALRRQDASYTSGRIIGSMGTAPRPVARAVHRLFLDANLGDPGHVPGAAKLERRYGRILLDLAAAKGHAGVAQVTSGASEANILALAWMRLRSGAKEIIVPRTGHFSLEKAAKFLGLKLRIADIDSRHRVDVESVRNLVGPQTAGIVAVAGTTQVGSIDPIRDVAQVALEHDVPLHVDAAFGGYVLPFLKPRVSFGFDIEGVESIAIDTHKMAMGTIGAGAILFRHPDELEELAVETPYLSTPRQRGILGTRSAGAVAAAVAAWEELGATGYGRIVATCMRDTRFFTTELRKAGIEPLVDPELNLVAVAHPEPEQLQTVLAEQGWRINVLTRLRAVRIVVMPHVTRGVLREFIPTFIDAHQRTRGVSKPVVHAQTR